MYTTPIKHLIPCKKEEKKVCRQTLFLLNTHGSEPVLMVGTFIRKEESRQCNFLLFLFLILLVFCNNVCLYNNYLRGNTY